MKLNLDLKKQAFIACVKEVNEQMERLGDTLNRVEDGMKDSTKSSSGDKFETNTAMMHLEKEKIDRQILECSNLKRSLRQVNPNIKNKVVELGALLKTKTFNMFISTGIGKIPMEGFTFMAVSTDAPIVKAMLGKKKGESFTFNGKEMEVLELI